MYKTPSHDIRHRESVSRLMWRSTMLANALSSFPVEEIASTTIRLLFRNDANIACIARYIRHRESVSRLMWRSAMLAEVFSSFPAEEIASPVKQQRDSQ